MKKKILFVLLMCVLVLTGCDSTKKFSGLNGDYKMVDGYAYANGTSTSLKGNSGIFMTVTDMNNVDYRTGAGTKDAGTISNKEVKDDVITCKVTYPEGSSNVWGNTYFTYDLKNPDQITYYACKEADQTDPKQATIGMVVTFQRKAEGEPDSVELSALNLKSFLTYSESDGADFGKKSKSITIYDEQVYDANNYYYLEQCNGYDALHCDVTIKGKSGYTFENASVSVTLSGKIYNPWAALEMLGCRVSSSKKQVKDVSETITIPLDSNGNGTGTITINSFGTPFNINNCIVDFSLDVSYTGSGKVIFK